MTPIEALEYVLENDIAVEPDKYSVYIADIYANFAEEFYIGHPSKMNAFITAVEKLKAETDEHKNEATE